MRITYYEDDNFCFQYVIYNETVFLHALVSCFKPSVLKKMFFVFNSFLSEMKEKGLTEIYSLTPNPKFCELLGGRFKDIIECNGEEYEVYKWELILSQ